MDLEKNRIPDDVKRIHLIAVCGTGMGALACMLKDLGFEVTGSDQRAYPPMSRFLEAKGIYVSDGFDEKNLNDAPDLVVVGNAVIRNNPEAVRMQEMGLYYCSMPQALNRFVAAGKKTIMITGTHGKTTTAAVTAWMLQKAGLDPSFFIGGILKNFNSNYRLGTGNYMVVEGDEYDTAYFNKVPKFVHYDPLLTVLTSVEFDHADIYSDIEHVTRVFDRFLSGLSEKSTLFAYDSDPIIDAVLSNKPGRIVRYGKSFQSDWHLGDVRITPPFTRFEVFRKGALFETFKTSMQGEHNLLNAVSAVAMADAVQIPKDAIREALLTFEGVKRRQEIRGRKRDITVMDDFAHHPTAVKETIRAVKPFVPDGRLVAVFEPRTHASMRRVFQNVYPESFDDADLICVREPPMLQKVPADDQFSSEKLVADLINRGKDAHYFPDTDAIIDYLTVAAKPHDLILIMSNGGFDNIHERLLESL
jgi:UDP-N-acetylmuramate: L-alanyl-gamma-D-glutamyl-meso-diaminopimelate ligase